MGLGELGFGEPEAMFPELGHRELRATKSNDRVTLFLDLSKEWERSAETGMGVFPK